MIDAGLVFGVLDHGVTRGVFCHEITLDDGQSDPILDRGAIERRLAVGYLEPGQEHIIKSLLGLVQRERLGIYRVGEVAEQEGKWLVAQY